MSDEKGPDEKILCVPLGDPFFERVRDIHDVNGELRDEIEHFFQRYKDLEPSRRPRRAAGETEARHCRSSTEARGAPSCEAPESLGRDARSL